MRKLFVMGLAALMAASCTKSNTAVVDAHIEGADNKLVMVAQLSVNQMKLVDTVRTDSKGTFKSEFAVSEETWENLDTDYPTRKINKIDSVVEISAVTFPAYESTEIYARSSEAMEIAKQTLESARKRNASPLESEGKDELELLKAKFRFKAQY